MNVWGPDREPTPQELAAYFDGELAPREQAAVEAWLHSHPEARAEIDSLRHLQVAYEAIPLPEPSPAAWERTRERIVDRLNRVRPTPSWNWLALAAVGLAAALLGLLLLPPGTAEDHEPFPVVLPNEVLIISMNPNDHGALVGVQPLELPEIDLAGHNDVDILGGHREGMMRIDDWASPMIVDPLAYGGPR